jgi:transcriptional regulator with XRE-family HTH domain
MKKPLKAWLKSSNTTQNQLAVQLGIHRSAVTHWVKGHNKPDREKLKRLSEITGISVEELL